MKIGNPEIELTDEEMNSWISAVSESLKKIDSVSEFYGIWVSSISFYGKTEICISENILVKIAKMLGVEPKREIVKQEAPYISEPFVRITLKHDGITYEAFGKVGEDDRTEND